ncbi:MAG: hypothetical protein JWP81_2832 [Ferruginibacter sp.]|nr:hypothetical protein [Ferruginibacter sp.]
MVTKEEVSIYNIKSYKEVVSGTNKLILLFIFTLTYVWFQSIEPNFNRIKRLKKNEVIVQHFQDSVIKKQKEKRDFYKARFTSLGNKQDSLRAKKNDSTLLYFNSLKEDMKQLRDSLNGKINLKIDIPTLSAIELPLQMGLIVWFILFLLFILLVLHKRVVAGKYLVNGLYYYRQKIQANNYNLKCLDIQLPFWLAPLVITGSNYQRKVLFVITTWTIVKKVLAAVVIVFLLSLLCRVWWISINIFKTETFDRPVPQSIFTSALLVTPLILIISWILTPLKIKFNDGVY